MKVIPIDPGRIRVTVNNVLVRVLEREPLSKVIVQPDREFDDMPMGRIIRGEVVATGPRMHGREKTIPGRAEVAPGDVVRFNEAHVHAWSFEWEGSTYTIFHVLGCLVQEVK